MNFKKWTLNTLMLFFNLSAALAQQAFTSAGGDSASTGGTVSYSIGTVVYTTNSGSFGSVAQGIQQPYEISIVTDLDEIVSKPEISCSVFPNPTNDIVILKINNQNISAFSYKIFDLNGNLLRYKKAEGYQTNVAMQSFMPATYFLKVYMDNQEFKTFQIIKNQ